MNNPCVTDPAAFPAAFDHAPNTRDMDALLALYLLALYDPAAIFRASDGILQRGIPALKIEVHRLISAKAELHNRLRQVFISADTALIRVNWTLRLTVPASGNVDGKAWSRMFFAPHPSTAGAC